MATAIDHLKTAGVVAAIAMGATAMLRSTGGAPAEIPSHPAPPPPCAAACKEMAKTCPAEGRAANCEEFLSRYQSTDGGWNCSQPLTRDALVMLGLERCAP